MKAIPVLLASVLLCGCGIVGAQSPPECLLVPQSQLRWSDVGAQGVWLGPVPPGKVWELRAAGGFTNDGKARDYMMELSVPPGYVVPIQKNQAPQDHTPVIALERPLLMFQNEYITVRTCCGYSPDSVAPPPIGTEIGGRVGISMAYYEWDAASPCYKDSRR